MKMKVKCTGYKKGEMCFTVGNVYEWDNNTMKSDYGFIYNDFMVGGTDPDKWLLSKWYSFEVVKDKKEFKDGDKVTICQRDVLDRKRNLLLLLEGRRKGRKTSGCEM